MAHPEGSRRRGRVGVRGAGGAQTFFIVRDGTISQRYYAQVPDDLFEQELAKIAKPLATPATTIPPR